MAYVRVGERKLLIAEEEELQHISYRSAREDPHSRRPDVGGQVKSKVKRCVRTGGKDRRSRGGRACPERPPRTVANHDAPFVKGEGNALCTVVDMERYGVTYPAAGSAGLDLNILDLEIKIVETDRGIQSRLHALPVRGDQDNESKQ